MKKRNMRKAYGEALLELGRERKNVVALEADLGKSTMSILFGNEFPERYFQMGIAEANMISTAAGLALTGHGRTRALSRCSPAAVPMTRSVPPWRFRG